MGQKLQKVICPRCKAPLLWAPQPIRVLAYCPKCAVWSKDPDEPSDFEEFLVKPTDA